MPRKKPTPKPTTESPTIGALDEKVILEDAAQRDGHTFDVKELVELAVALFAARYPLYKRGIFRDADDQASLLHAAWVELDVEEPFPLRGF